MKKIFILIISCFIICGCTTASKDGNNNLTKNEIKNIMLTKDYKIIDVRTKEEYDSGHVEDAINIPYDELQDKINFNKDIILFVYCKSGNRSNIAYNTLNQLGYEVYDLGAYEKIELEKIIH